MGNTSSKKETQTSLKTELQGLFNLIKHQSIYSVKKPISMIHIDTASNELQEQLVPQTFKNWQRNKHYTQFIQLLDIICQCISYKICPQNNSQSIKKWQEAFTSFNKHYLTLTDRLKLLNLMSEILSAEFNKYQTNEDSKKQAQCQIGLQTEKKLKFLKERIKSHRSRANEYLKFMKEFSSYKMDFSDIKKVASKVHDFCKKDMNAFNFITLYLVHSANEQLNKNPNQLLEIVEKLKSVFDQLSKQYPPSDTKNETTQKRSSTRINYDKPVNYPMIKFISEESKEKFHEIQSYLKNKTKQAMNDKFTFDKIIQPVCLKRGNYFQSSLKVDINEKSLLPFFRILEKILLKQDVDAFSTLIQSKRNTIIKQIKERPEFDKVSLIGTIWERHFIEIITQNLLGKMNMSFSLGDLLRGKAMFKNSADIDETAKDIEEALKKWPNQQCRILKTQDRLDKPTKDFQMTLQIRDTITELQLVIEMNKESNEFNHKIYELKRSYALTPLINLKFIHEKLQKLFFDDHLDFCYHMMECQDKQFITYKSDLQEFEKNYLVKNRSSIYYREVKEGFIISNNNNIHWYDINKKIEYQIKEMLKVGYKLKRN